MKNKIANHILITSLLMAAIFALALFSSDTKATEFNVEKFLSKIYVKVGIGYKFKETQLTFMKDGVRTEWNDPYSARFEIGIRECMLEFLTCGWSHGSQWLSGWPVNTDYEYSNDQFFIDAEFTLDEIYYLFKG